MSCLRCISLFKGVISAIKHSTNRGIIISIQIRLATVSFAPIINTIIKTTLAKDDSISSFSNAQSYLIGVPVAHARSLYKYLIVPMPIRADRSDAVPGNIQYGQHFLNVEFENSTIRVPFTIMTKEELKENKAKWKEMQKEHKRQQKEEKKAAKEAAKE